MANLIVRVDNLTAYRSMAAQTMRDAYLALESARATAYQGAKVFARLADLNQTVTIRDSQSEKKSNEHKVMIKN